jgi:hypothetical protein
MLKSESIFYYLDKIIIIDVEKKHKAKIFFTLNDFLSKYFDEPLESLSLLFNSFHNLHSVLLDLRKKTNSNYYYYYFIIILFLFLFLF